MKIEDLLKKWDTGKIESLLHQFIKSSNYSPTNPNAICLKLDLLERLIQVLRIKNRNLENDVTFEEFIQGMVLPDTAQMRFIAANTTTGLGCGTAPIFLQPKLLLFLLLYHREKFQIYEIIEQFVQRIWNELEPVDFKKTQTGVTRCFTNTRFAANNLRMHGFLRYTQDEAFKTWVLSLPGFIVASKVLEQRNWNIERDKREANFDLHSTVRTAWKGLESFDKMVERLRSLCEPNVDVFDTFEGYLIAAHALLTRYWQALSNADCTQRKRVEISKGFMVRLDNDPRTKEFCEELSASIKIDDAIRQSYSI